MPMKKYDNGEEQLTIAINNDAAAWLISKETWKPKLRATRFRYSLPGHTKPTKQAKASLDKFRQV
jgi:hypothetical protein